MPTRSFQFQRANWARIALWSLPSTTKSSNIAGNWTCCTAKQQRLSLWSFWIRLKRGSGNMTIRFTLPTNPDKRPKPGNRLAYGPNALMIMALLWQLMHNDYHLPWLCIVVRSNPGSIILKSLRLNQENSLELVGRLDLRFCCNSLIVSSVLTDEVRRSFESKLTRQWISWNNNRMRILQSRILLQKCMLILLSP